MKNLISLLIGLVSISGMAQSERVNKCFVFPSSLCDSKDCPVSYVVTKTRDGANQGEFNTPEEARKRASAQDCFGPTPTGRKICYLSKKAFLFDRNGKAFYEVPIKPDDICVVKHERREFDLCFMTTADAAARMNQEDCYQ